MPYQPAVLGSARLNNFRLNYLTADQAATRPARIWFILGGVDISAPTSPTRVIYKSVSIRDVVFDTPNTCQITFYGAAPTLGARLEVWVDSNNPTLLFGGELQTVDRTYQGRPTTVLHPCTAIDDTARANRKRPLGLFTNVSATTIAQTLISTYAPGYSSAGVEANLPAVSINFDGSEGGMKGCLTALAKIIGGFWYFENRTLYLFITPPGPSPDPIDDSPQRFLHDPQIRHSVDKSQVRTRVYGKGASSDLAATVDQTVTIVPLDEVTMFNPAGGKAIAAVTPDGAASRVLTYTGVQVGGGGGLVGPGASPSAAPGLALLTGVAGVNTGVHRYAITFLSASGESLPGPVAAISVGPVAAPTTAPVPGAVTTGGAVNPGTYQYGVTFVTPTGETLGGPASAPVTVAAAIADPGMSTFTNGFINVGTGGPYPFPSNGGPWYWKYSFVTAGGETLPSPARGGSTSGGGPFYAQGQLPIGPAGTIARRIYRATASGGPYNLATHIPNNTATLWEDKATALGAAAPTGNTTATYKTIPLSQIPIGPSLVTARKLYRFNGTGAYRLVDTIANNTATTYTDTKAEASLGAGAPGTNTAQANQVTVTVPVGGSGVTGRKVYRSAANVTPLQLLATLGDNTTTSLHDPVGDASLGAAPPAVDTSGLQQPSGQVLPGATTVIVANTQAFPAAGGWAVIGNGDQVIRYTSATATSLTGVPASGIGAVVAAVSYNSTITAAPALVGVTGILETMLEGARVHVWVQRDDLAAQAYMLALDGTGDGVYEHIVSDERRSEASLVQLCEAELALYSRPLVSVTYATRDTKTKSGKTVTIALASPSMSETLTIQDVAISEIGIAPTLRPKFTATASSVRHSFDAILQQLLRKAGA